MTKSTPKSTLSEKIRNKFFYFVTFFPAVAYVAFFFVIIVFNLLVFSFSEYSGGDVVGISLKNYTEVFNDPDFSSAYIRTLLFVLVVTPAQLFTGFITASLINSSFRGRGIVRGIFVVPLALPVMVTSAVFFILFASSGHINSLLLGEYSFFPQLIEEPISFIGDESSSFILTSIAKVWRDTPASMLILLAGMQSIDEAQYEAAMTMGASKMQRTLFITVPLLVPSISSVLVLRSIEAWKEFVFPYILSPSYPVLSVLIDEYYNVIRNPGLTAVVGIILIVSILLFSQTLKFVLSLINRYLVKV